MLTADSSPMTAVTALEAGADDHVLKPFSLPVLLACIERRLRVVGPAFARDADSGSVD
jgi:DNA-binding response OmpR family regulator